MSPVEKVAEFANKMLIEHAEKANLVHEFKKDRLSTSQIAFKQVLAKIRANGNCSQGDIEEISDLLHNEWLKRNKIRASVEQRLLFKVLTSQSVEINGSGRLQKQVTVDSAGNETVIYKEKGVDVQIAVDITAQSYIDPAVEIYLLSSDSDLIPAINHSRKNKLNIIYIATEMRVTKSLRYSCNKFVVLSKENILEVFKNKTPIE